MTTTETNKRDWVALEHKYYQGTFKRQPITLVRGEGPRVWDSEGRVLLDFVAGIAVNVLGHCHPAIVQAVQQQVTQLVHVSNLYYNTRQIELAELLAIQSNGMRSFFSNSGAEANEGVSTGARWRPRRLPGRLSTRQHGCPFPMVSSRFRSMTWRP